MTDIRYYWWPTRGNWFCTGWARDPDEKPPRSRIRAPPQHLPTPVFWDHLPEISLPAPEVGVVKKDLFPDHYNFDPKRVDCRCHGITGVVIELARRSARSFGDLVTGRSYDPTRT